MAENLANDIISLAQVDDRLPWTQISSTSQSSSYETAGAAKARKIPTLLHLSAQQWDSFFAALHCYLVCFSEWQISDKGSNPVAFFFDAIHHVPQT